MSVLSSMKRDLSSSNHAAEENNQAQLYAEMIQQHFQSEVQDMDEGNANGGGMQKLLFLGESSNKGIAELPNTTQGPSTLSKAMGAEQSFLLNAPFAYNDAPETLPSDPPNFSEHVDHAARFVNERLPAMDSPTLSAACYLLSPPWTPPMIEDTEKPPPKPKRAKIGGKKAAWKPNNDQLRILDQHLNAGKPPAMSTLLKALQKCGRVTSGQLSTWLNHRRSKARSCGSKAENGEKSDGSENSLHVNRKGAQEGDLEQAFQEFDQDLNSVMAEMNSILGAIKGSAIQALCRALLQARHVVCHGVGPEGYIMQAFACDLNQLGMKAFYLTDISMPQISEDDVFLVSAGPSFYATVSALALEAKRLGARVIAFTAHPSADMLFADDVIRIPSQTLTPSMPILSKKPFSLSETVSFLPDGNASVLNLGDSYNLGLKITHEGVLCTLRCKLSSLTL